MDPRIERVVSLMQANLQRDLPLSVMCQAACLSASRFRHKFKAEIGTTPTLYLRGLRLELASDLLRSDRVAIKEVRAAVGLQSDSYFSRQFKRRFGVTPSAWRGHYQ